MSRSGIRCYLFCILMMPTVLWCMVIVAGFSADYFLGEQVLLDWYHSLWKSEVLEQVIADGKKALLWCYLVGLTLYLIIHLFNPLLLRWLVSFIVAAMLFTALIFFHWMPSWHVALVIAATLFIYGLIISFCSVGRVSRR